MEVPDFQGCSKVKPPLKWQPLQRAPNPEARSWAQEDGTCDASTGKCSSGPGEPHGGALIVSWSILLKTPKNKIWWVSWEIEHFESLDIFERALGIFVYIYNI